MQRSYPSLFVDAATVRSPGDRLIPLHRRRNEIPLRQIAAHVAQEVKRAFVLNALGRGLQAQAAPQIDD